MPEPPLPSGRLIGKRTEPAELDPQATARMSPAEEADRAQAAAALQEGVLERLGQYQIDGEIARGGMGVVYKGYHKDLKRAVAIKLLRADVAGDDSLERFMREARATAKLSRHPGIVAIHDVGEDDSGRPYLVMDFVEGNDLREVLAAGPLSPERAAQLMVRLCQAVAHAHDHGILHRDLKPHNVMIDGHTGEPLLTDFGLAKSVDRRGGETSKVHQLQAVDSDSGPIDLTRADEIMGTPLYMAPEQIDGERGEIGKRTDVYALGVMLYECLTGDVPFNADSVYEVFDKILSVPPVAPKVLRASIPSDLQAIALRALEKSPMARYRTAGEMAKDLERFLAKKPVLGVTHRAPKPRLSLTRPLLTLLALGAVIGAVVYAPEDLKARAHNAAQAFLSDPATEPVATAPVATASVGSAPVAPAPVAPAVDPAPPPRPSFGAAVSDPLPSGIEGLRARAATDARARTRLVNLLFKEGTGEAYREAAEHLEVFAADGRIDALIALGDMHGLVGTWEWTRPEVALRAWREAAEKGSSVAMLRLAGAYQHGQSLAPPDDVKALGWLRRAANAKNPDAMLQLGRAQELGALGLARDARKARRWYRQAADLGQAAAKAHLERLSASRG